MSVENLVRPESKVLKKKKMIEAFHKDGGTTLKACSMAKAELFEYPNNGSEPFKMESTSPQ